MLAAKQEIYKEAMELALSLGRETRKRDGRVAVSCMDQDRLNEYVPAASAQYQNEYNDNATTPRNCAMLIVALY